MISVGTEVIANWGAYLPEQEGVIIKINTNGGVVIEFECSDDQDCITWNHECRLSDIRESKPNGVGIYILEHYMNY